MARISLPWFSLKSFGCLSYLGYFKNTTSLDIILDVFAPNE